MKSSKITLNYSHSDGLLFLLIAEKNALDLIGDMVTMALNRFIMNRP